MSNTPTTAHWRNWVPPGVDVVALGALVVGLLLLYVPTFFELARTVWPTDEQGHGPIILAVAWWLLFRLREPLAALEPQPARWLGWALIGFALLLVAFGRSQTILMFEVGSQILMLAGLLLLFVGWRGLRLAWFPLVFLLFMVPLPETLVTTVTTPLKTIVSTIAESILALLGLPVARTGVILYVGQYQLLVADACAGLNSMFTLEALGLLYMNLMQYTNAARNIALAILIIPISFCANVIRVMILVLVTYYFGDEAGQGFVHGFAGMVLFMVALVLMLATDSLLNLVPRFARRRT